MGDLIEMGEKWLLPVLFTVAEADDAGGWLSAPAENA